MKKKEIIEKCKILLKAYQTGKLGDTTMPEDQNPWEKFFNLEEKILYFTLPMSLNYQRNSYNLRKSALDTYNDEDTRLVFNLKFGATANEEILREKLMKYKLALQKNKHIATWHKISATIYKHRGSIQHLFKYSDYDFLKLKRIMQVDYKKWFPYISWAKIFNYWASILPRYAWVSFKNSEFIDIAVDTHVLQSSIKLWVISEEEKDSLSKEEIHKRWREILKWSWINPSQMHSPLWFWSRGKFVFEI